MRFLKARSIFESEINDLIARIGPIKGQIRQLQTIKAQYRVT